MKKEVENGVFFFFCRLGVVLLFDRCFYGVGADGDCSKWRRGTGLYSYL